MSGLQSSESVIPPISSEPKFPDATPHLPILDDHEVRRSCFDVNVGPAISAAILNTFPARSSISSSSSVTSFIDPSLNPESPQPAKIRGHRTRNTARKPKTPKPKAKTVAQLRNELKALGLSPVGKKAVLLQRLADAAHELGEENPSELAGLKTDPHLEETDHGVRLVVYGRPWFYLNKTSIEMFVPLTLAVVGTDTATLSVCLNLFTEYLGAMAQEMARKAEDPSHVLEHTPAIE